MKGWMFLAVTTMVACGAQEESATTGALEQREVLAPGDTVAPETGTINCGGGRFPGTYLGALFSGKDYTCLGAAIPDDRVCYWQACVVTGGQNAIYTCKVTYTVKGDKSYEWSQQSVCKGTDVCREGDPKKAPGSLYCDAKDAPPAVATATPVQETLPGLN